MTEQERIGWRIAELRKEKGMTLRDLSAKCGINISNLSRIERGAISAGVESIAAIAQALGCKVQLIADNIKRFKITIEFDNGDKVNAKSVGLNRAEAIERLIRTEPFLEFQGGKEIVSVHTEETPYISIDDSRFKLHISAVKPNTWVLTDLENMWVCTFEENKFQKTQHFVDVKEEQDTDPGKIATIMREFGEWLANNVPDIV